MPERITIDGAERTVVARDDGGRVHRFIDEHGLQEVAEWLGDQPRAWCCVEPSEAALAAEAARALDAEVAFEAAEAERLAQLEALFEGWAVKRGFLSPTLGQS